MADMDGDDDFKRDKPKYKNDEERKNGKYGDDAKDFKVDEKMKGGLIREGRGCTDCPCLLIFLAFVGSMGYLSFYGH